MTKNQLANSQKVLEQVLKGNVSNLSRSDGFTLIESLVAMIVISITLVAITPPIFFATATRVQNRRAEQALALAQGELDRVRAQVERGKSPLSDLPDSVGTVTAFRNYPAPLTAWANMRSTDPTKNTAEKIPSGTNQYPRANQYTPVDTDGDGKTDFFIQVFREDGLCNDNQVNPGLGGGRAACTNENPPTMFSVKVRVYAGIAEPNAGSGRLLIEPASLRGSTGTGQATFRPLSVLSSQVARSVDSKTLEQYQSR